jgi:maltoporin
MRPHEQFSLPLLALFSLTTNSRDGHLWKITLAPRPSRGGRFFSRPVLRAFITCAKWGDDFKGQAGGSAYENATDDWSYGLQTEAWW